jgi:tetratricopeptide (TPR) repeat protein
VSKKPSKPVGKAGRSAEKSGPRLYTLEVLLIDGPVNQEFLKANPKISRTLQVRGDQTFHDLAGAINDAFDLDDDHLYTFYVPQSRSKRDGEELEELGEPISSLDLHIGSRIRYHFDFGDDWKYDVKVKALGEPGANEKYPKVIQKVGESPPQYPDADEDDWDDESEEDMPEAAAADVSLLIGEMHLKAGEYAKAVEAFTRSIEANPSAADEYEGRSRAYRALANEDERKAKELRAGPG